MKKIILLLIIFFTSTLFYAQELIDHGFVFVDGKYIEGPYKITMEDFNVYINGNLINHGNYPQPDLRVSTDPGIPKGLTKEMGLAALDNVRDSVGDVIILKRISYFYQNFPKEEADEKASAFLKTLPFLKAFRLNDIFGSIYLEDYYNKSRNFQISSQKPQRPLTLKESIDGANRIRLYYENYLKDGDCFIFSKYAEIHLSGKHAARVLQKVVDGLSDPTKSLEEKKELLDSCGVISKKAKWIEGFIKSFKIDKSINKKIQEHVEFIKKKYGVEVLKPKGIKKQKEQKSLKKGASSSSINDEGTAYSPDGELFYVFYPDAFQMWPYCDDEIYNIYNEIKDLGYSDDNGTCIYKDWTANDDNLKSCTYTELESCFQASVFLLGTHGPNTGGGFCSAFFKTQEAADYYIANGPTGAYKQQVEKVIFDGNYAWAVILNTAWVLDTFSEDFSNYNTISILSVCKSAKVYLGLSLLESFQSQASLGYVNDVYPSQAAQVNREFFGRMNGTIGNKQYRKAEAAYNNLQTISCDIGNGMQNFDVRNNLGLTYYSEDDMEITLCPATKSCFPANGTTNVPASGEGYFETDTYCDITISPQMILSFSTTGDVTISNVRWDSQEKSSKILFTWTGTGDFSVNVNVNTYWMASSGNDYHHCLDFDGIAPNEETVASFTFSHNISSQDVIITPPSGDIFENTLFTISPAVGKTGHIIVTDGINEQDTKPPTLTYNFFLSELNKPVKFFFIRNYTGTFCIKAALLSPDWKTISEITTANYNIHSNPVGVEDYIGVILSQPSTTELNENDEIICDAGLVDYPPTGDYLVGTLNWSIQFLYNCSGDICGVYTLLEDTSNPIIAWRQNIGTLPSGFHWDRDINGNVKGQIVVTGQDNAGASHTSRLPITVKNIPYIISGKVFDNQGNPLKDVVISNSQNSETKLTDDFGEYYLTIPKFWTGTVTPSISEYTFSPTSVNISSVTTDYINQNFIGTLPSIISLSNSWNWVSFARNSDNNALSSILGTSAYSSEDIIKDQYSYSQFLDGTGWIGSLNEVGFNSMYKIKLASPRTLTLSGNSISSTSNPVTLNSGWTWISYFLDYSIEINDALLDLQSKATPNDKITDVEGRSATFSDGTWSGTLTALEPSEGYMYHSLAGSSISFNWPSTQEEILPKTTEQNNYLAVLEDFKINPRQYGNRMYITAEINNALDLLGADNILTAYINNECVGAVKPVFVKPENKDVYFLTVFSDNNENREISFKIFSNNKTKALNISNIILFKNNGLVGDLTKPINLTIESRNNKGMPTEYSLSQNYPNPFNPATTINFALPESRDVKIIIYNSLGQEVRTILTGMLDIGYHSITWDGKDEAGNTVSSGLYLYRMTAGSYIQTRKMMLLK